MEDVTVPGWAIVVFTGCVVPWLIYLTIMAFKGEKHQGISDTIDQRMQSDLSRIEVKLDDTKHHIDGSLDKFEGKFEKFENKMDKMFDRAIDLLKLATKQ